MSILESLVEEKGTKYRNVRGRVTEVLAIKIRDICKKANIKEEEYIGKIIEESEISKVHKQLFDESKDSNEKSNQ